MKKFTTDNGSRCSGYGVYPDGRKCKGCSDCNGKFLKRSITTKEIHQVFNKTHLIATVGKHTDVRKLIQKKLNNTKC